jgi:replicative DNA helicase
MSFVPGQPASRPTADELLRQLAGDSTARAAAPWEGEPVPLSARRLLPPFPVDALPAWLADMVAALADFTQTPADLPGCLALACLATAASGRAVVQVRPGWREPTNLFVVVALPPGSRKSPVFAAMTEPILTAERSLQENSAPPRARAEVEARAARAHAAEVARIAESAYATEHGAKAIDDAADAKTAADQLAVPAVPRLVADDITPEAAASLLAEQGGRLAVLSAEGGIFATLAGRYSGQPNLEVFLKGHAGDLLVVDRKGRDSEYVAHPALTLGLAVQPELLKDIASVPGFRGRGLLARIVYSLPATTVGRRRVGTPPPDEAVVTEYTTNLRALVLTLADWTDPAVLTLTRDANDAVLHLEETLEPRLHPDRGDLAPIVDWASKYVGATARLAGLIHLAAHRDALTRPISVQTVQSAARLGHYYLGHALAVFDLMGADPMVDNARHVLDWIARTGTTHFTRRDLFTAVSRGRFRKVTELDPVLDLLDQHGYIRPRELPPRAGAGRPPSPTFDVHPNTAESAESAESAQPPPRSLR